MPNTKKGKQAARRERAAALRARQKRAERRRTLILIGAVTAVVAVIIGGVAWYAASRSSGSSNSASGEVIPPGVTGTTTVQAAAHQVPNTLDLSPYPGLPSPIFISSWGFQLKVSSPTDPRLQQFVTKFRASPAYTPEYGGACTGGVGTPLQT